jgi:hypothetical protein
MFASSDFLAIVDRLHSMKIGLCANIVFSFFNLISLYIKKDCSIVSLILGFLPSVLKIFVKFTPHFKGYLPFRDDVGQYLSISLSATVLLI